MLKVVFCGVVVLMAAGCGAEPVKEIKIQDGASKMPKGMGPATPGAGGKAGGSATPKAD